MGLWGSTMGAFGMGGSGGGTGGTAFSQFGQPPPPALPSQGIAPVPWGNGSEDPTRNPPPGGMFPQMGGVTRRGSQILDAQGNVIGHYDDNNQPVYHGGQGPQIGSKFPGQVTPAPQFDAGTGMGFGQRPQGPIASTSMGMAPSYARLGVPGSMQQSLYGNGLLRPAMPSMNNQSGY